jgi:multisubunit Na+/H+ antiporter MnhE subunit
VIALLPLFVAVVLGNALTHIVWLFHFRTYAPGVVTSALLLAPLTVYLIHRVLRERLAPRAYVWALTGLALLQPLGAVAAGSSLSGSQLALQRLGMRLSQWLWGSA